MSLPGTIAKCQSIRCQSYALGHNMHPIHAKRVGQTPWGWRDAVVTDIHGLSVSLAYLDEQAGAIAYHHRPYLVEALRVGDPVRLHDQYFVVGHPGGWFSVVIDGGLGPVPEPRNLSAWRERAISGVVDLGTGIALATDHLLRE